MSASGMTDHGRVVAVLQARMSSTRLPGKVLRPILGRPMLALQLERLARCGCLDALVLATSDQSEDDAVAALGADLGVGVFRGSLSDVLDRFHGAARAHGADHVVRLTGDCPLADPGVVDDLVDFYFESGADYAANCVHPCLPDGLDAEVFSMAALEQAWAEALLPSQREHVTPWMRDCERLSKAHWRREPGLPDLSGLRWTVDDSEDFAFVTAVYEALYPGNAAFTTADVLDLLARRPELAALNAGAERNEGLLKSLREDQAWLAARAGEGEKP